MYRTRRRTTEKLINIVVPCVSMRMLMRFDHKSRLVGTVGRCPLYPQKQTLYRSHGMSVRCQQKTFHLGRAANLELVNTKPFTSPAIERGRAFLHKSGDALTSIAAAHGSRDGDAFKFGRLLQGHIIAGVDDTLGMTERP